MIVFTRRWTITEPRHHTIVGVGAGAPCCERQPFPNTSGCRRTLVETAPRFKRKGPLSRADDTQSATTQYVGVRMAATRAHGASSGGREAQPQSILLNHDLQQLFKQPSTRSPPATVCVQWIPSVKAAWSPKKPTAPKALTSPQKKIASFLTPPYRADTQRLLIIAADHAVKPPCLHTPGVRMPFPPTKAAAATLMRGKFTQQQLACEEPCIHYDTPAKAQVHLDLETAWWHHSDLHDEVGIASAPTTDGQSGRNLLLDVTMA